MKNIKPTILLTNDDGINSPGIIALERQLSHIGNIFVVAPDRERSAVSHSITLHHPLRVHQIDNQHFALDGTPTDCVLLGVLELLKIRPDIVISGINIGPNLGDDITFSGTVAAAMEGTLLGIPSCAISLNTRTASVDFKPASIFSERITLSVLKQGLPKDTLLNVNIPLLPEKNIQGIRFVRQGRRIYRDSIIKKTDPRGRFYYWIGGEEPSHEREENTDFHAIEEGYIAITPLHLNLTNDYFLKHQAHNLLS